MRDPIEDVMFKEQLASLFKKIKEVLGFPIIMSAQVSDPPKNENGETDYPYVAYTIMTTNRTASVEYKAETQPSDENIVSHWQETWNMTISFTAVSKDPFSVVETITALFDWLSERGRNEMQHLNIAYVSTQPSTNRDMLMVNDYERRHGKDIVLRFGRVTTVTEPRIKTVDIPEPIINP